MSSLTKRAVVQTAGFLILFAIIFACAGTIRFWQGWLFCVSFWFSTIAIGIYLMNRDPALLERRMRFGPVVESRPIQKIIVTITFVLFVALAVVPALDHRFGWSRVPGAIVVIANILMVASFGLFLVVLRENSFAASTITVEAGQRVISTGPYAHVRHPMYAAATWLFVGIPLALGSWWSVGVIVPLIPVLLWRLLDEENVLQRDLPGYSEYMRRVRCRLVPFVW